MTIERWVPTDTRELLEANGYHDQMDGAGDDGVFYDEDYGEVISGTPPNISYINESGVRDEEMEDWFAGRQGRAAQREIANLVEKWTQSLNGGPQQTLDVFNRRRWHGAQHIFAQMSQCAWAVENDDVLSTLADVLEGLMFQKCHFELFDVDQQSIWNQWAAEVNLDARLREAARELFKVSQVYVGLWWEDKVYKVKDDPIAGTIEEMERKKEEREYEDKVKARNAYIAMFSKMPGYVEPPEVPELPTQNRQGNRSRRKVFPLRVPTQMTIFDPTKVVPVGTLLFGRERFAYVADRGEDEAFASVMRGDKVDGTVLQLVEKKYTPTAQDTVALQELGVDPNRLWLFKQDAVFRHSLTKASYERFAPVRLKPALELIELKGHLRSADRATLIGNTNFIVVITKGSDKLPAKPAEIANLQEQARVIARLPVLVGDHRLEVKIVSPDMTNIMMPTRWDVIDSRLVFKALNTYAPVIQGGNSSGTGISEMSRVVANGLMNRRHMLMRSLEAAVFQKILDKNEAVPSFGESPSLEFSPRKISLDFNQDIINGVLKLRDRGDISRETTLDELDFDQDVEVLRRARERVDYDRVFESSTPFSSPATQPYQPGQPGQPGVLNLPPAAGGPQPPAQPPKEGGRPPGTAESAPRQQKGRGKARAKS